MVLTQAKHETTPTTDFLFQAALLAGLGQQARVVAQMVAQQVTNGRFSPHTDRSCIDAGSTLLLAVAAPGDRELRLVQRLGDGEDGGQRWLHTRIGMTTDDGRPTTDDQMAHLSSVVGGQSSVVQRRQELTAVYLRTPTTAWHAAHTLSQTTAAEAAFRRAHAVLGPRGRIFKCQQPVGQTTDHRPPTTEGNPSSVVRRPSSEPATDHRPQTTEGCPSSVVRRPSSRLTTDHRPPTTPSDPSSVVRRPSSSWITWQLDRQTTPAEALTAYGLPQSWTAVSAALAPLFGQPVSPRSRPWSISVALQEPDRVRVGTTAWARQPEEPGKHQRLAQTIEQFGGNGRFAEALYKLALTTHPPSLTTRIGRAVEVELWRGEVVGIEMYCCVGN